MQGQTNGFYRAEQPTPVAPDSDEETEGSALPPQTFILETTTAWVEDFFMAGVLAKIEFYPPMSIAVRASVDLYEGTSFIIPYFGCTIPKIGGFEIGVKKRYESANFFVPGWVTYRIFGGDERIFAISADILTHVPIGNIGYYSAGVTFRVAREGSTIFVGFANYGKDKEEIRIFGPAAKLNLYAGNNSFVVVSGSYILNNPGDNYIRYTMSIGWRMVF